MSPCTAIPVHVARSSVLIVLVLWLGLAVRAAEIPRRPLALIPGTHLVTGATYGNRLKAHPHGGFLVTATGGFPESVFRLDAQGNRIWGQWLSAMASVGLVNGGALIAGVEPATGVDYVATLTWLREDGSVEKSLPLDLGLPLPREGSLCVCSSAHELVPASDGGFLVVGSSTLGPGNGKASPAHGGLDGWVLRVDASGKSLWDRSYGTPGYELLERAAPLPGGGWMLAGLTFRPSGTMLLIRTDAAGDTLKERTVGPSSPTLSTWFQDMITTSAGDVFLTGWVGGSFEWPSALLVRLDIDGNQIWSRSFRTSGLTYPHSIVELANGDLLLTGGDSRPAGDIVSTWFRCISREGQVRWETRLPNSGSGFYRVTQALPLPDGRVSWITALGGKVLHGFLEPTSVPAAGDQLALMALPEFFPSHPEGYYSLNGPQQTRFAIERSDELQTWTRVITNIIGDTDFQFAPAGNASHPQFYRATPLD